MNLDALLDLLGKQAHLMLLEQGAPQLVPLYHICAPKGDLIIGCPWGNADEKAAALAYIKKTARKHKAQAVGFICEAWVSKYDAGTDLDNVPAPSQDPKRVEAVFALATDGNQIKSLSWQIVRDREGGTIIALSPDKQMDGCMFAGQMIDGILPHVTH
jgi:hypothetical protein